MKLTALAVAAALIATPAIATETCSELNGRGGSIVTGTKSNVLVYTYSADHLTVCVYGRNLLDDASDLGTAYWQAAGFNQPFVKLKGIDTPQPEHWQRSQRYSDEQVVWPDGVTHG